MYPYVCNFTWICTLLCPGNVYRSVSPLCANVCVRKCFHREGECMRGCMLLSLYMKLCGSNCVFFYNKIAMRKYSWSLKKIK